MFGTFPPLTCKGSEQGRLLLAGAVLLLLKQPILASAPLSQSQGRAETSLAKHAHPLLRGSELELEGNVSRSPP